MMQCWVCLSGCLWMHRRQPDQMMISNQQQPTVCIMTHKMESEKCYLSKSPFFCILLSLMLHSQTHETWMANKNSVLLFLGSLSNKSGVRTAITWEVKAEDRSPSQMLWCHPHCTFGLSSSIPRHLIQLTANWRSLDTSTPQQNNSQHLPFRATQPHRRWPSCSKGETPTQQHWDGGLWVSPHPLSASHLRQLQEKKIQPLSRSLVQEPVVGEEMNQAIFTVVITLPSTVATSPSPPEVNFHIQRASFSNQVSVHQDSGPHLMLKQQGTRLPHLALWVIGSHSTNRPAVILNLKKNRSSEHQTIRQCMTSTTASQLSQTVTEIQIILLKLML